MDDIINNTLAFYEDPATVKHREDLGGAAFVAHGWYSATRDWARGALLMEGAGLSRSAAPLRRSMIEHALALSWLTDAHEYVLASLRMAEQEHLRKLDEAMAGGGWSVPPGLIDSLLDPPATGSREDANLHIKHLTQRLAQPNVLVAWLHETATCHATLSSASRYVSTWPGEETKGLAVGDAAQSGKDQIALLLLLASDGFNNFLVGAPWTDQLADLERQFAEEVRSGKP